MTYIHHFNKDNTKGYKKLVTNLLGLTVLSLSLSACFGSVRTLQVRVITNKEINENSYISPSPVTLHFYELKSNKIFYKAQPEQLFLHEEDTLGDNLVHSKSFYIKPSMNYIFDIKFEDQSENLGISAEFFKITDKSTRWKYNINLADGNTDIQLYIYKQEILSAKEYEVIQDDVKTTLENIKNANQKVKTGASRVNNKLVGKVK